MKSIRETPRVAGEFEFSLGADPEFTIFNGQFALSASDTLRTFVTACDEEDRRVVAANSPSGFNIFEKLTENGTTRERNVGNLGWDGHSSTGEIRPSPSYSPREVARNIGLIYRELCGKMPIFDFTTLTIGAPIGGHIHVGCTRQEAGNAVMQTLLSSFLVPILASEHRVSTILRTGSSGYGKINDFRPNSYGQGSAESENGLEIRALTPEWTLTPKLAESTLAYIGVVWNEIRKHNKKLSKEPNVIRSKRQSQAIQELILSNYDSMTRIAIENIKAMVRKFELYEEFKEQIEYILDVEKVKRDKEAVGWNIGRGWGYVQVLQPTRRIVLNDKETTERLVRKNIDIIPDFVVSWNQDTNVT